MSNTINSSPILKVGSTAYHRDPGIVVRSGEVWIKLRIKSKIEIDNLIQSSDLEVCNGFTSNCSKISNGSIVGL